MPTVQTLLKIILKNMSALFFLMLLSCFDFYPQKENTSQPQTSVEFLETEFMEINFSKPRVKSYWVTTPDIIICDRVVPIRKVKAAVEFWNRLGYTFGEIKEESDAYQCMQQRTNEIVFKLPSTIIPIGDNLAVTRTYIEKNQRINLRAEIYIWPRSHQKILVIEHELGHAIGWSHTGISYHLMNPRWERIGHHTSGLNKREYIIQAEILRPRE
tara:strand:+ start:222 stop:863 length:642 start_codon:yes stop_codon:yes gene_type:complete